MKELNVTTIILGGGQGKRLFPLTKYRSKPAVPIGGKYRLVDIPISNSINSGLKKIFVLTQFNSTSLHRHIHRTYPYEFFTQTSVELLAAEQTPANTDWFQGTADAVRKHIPHYHLNGSDLVLILSGDHLYRMDYEDILSFHMKRSADVTIATVPVPQREVSQFGIMQIQPNGRIASFKEKPSVSEKIQSFIIPAAIQKQFSLKEQKNSYLASMGIYVFKPSVLLKLLEGTEADFGKEVIPKAIQNYHCYGYVFNGYWRDIGTIRSFYDASIELTKANARFDFFDPSGRIFTRARFLPPSKISRAELNNALVAEGCVIEGACVEDSVIGVRSIISKGTVIRKSVLMGNDYYDYSEDSEKGRLRIGKDCLIQNCIIDKNVTIGNQVSITNSKKLREADGPNYHIRDGIVIIPKDSIVKDGTII